MHRFAQVHDYILRHAVPAALGEHHDVPEKALANITVELPKDPTHGDMATNAAMVLAKPAGQKPRALAEAMQASLEAFPYMRSVDIAGPGFINMTFEPAFWLNELPVILKELVGYGNSAIGKGQRINVEYVSANPTGPMHIGHARGAVVGDALARLLQKASFEVTKEYYINDAGAQVGTLARSALLRYREAHGESITIPEGMYPGDYLIGVGEGLKHTYGDTLLNASDDETSWLADVQTFAVDAMMAMIRDDLRLLGIEHDVFTSEQALKDHGWLEQGLDTLTKKDLLYRGTLEPPKGKAPPEDWEPSEQTLFRSTSYGDDSDRPVIKSNGDYTYFAGDIAYTTQKISRGFDTLVMVLGADHGGYVARMKALTEALSDGATEMSLHLCQLVKLMDGGEPIKMSKRAGSFVTVRDVTEAVGKDVLRFIMLTRKPEQPLDFDLQKVREQSRENPVFYVQYAHARCKSVLRMAREQMPETVQASAMPEQVDMSLLHHKAELHLVKTMASYPRQVEAAARMFEPHRIAYYLQELAAEFHALWNLGNDDPAQRFIIEDHPALTTARLMLARCVATVLASGLQILGVEPAEEMR